MRGCYFFQKPRLTIAANPKATTNQATPMILAIRQAFKDYNIESDGWPEHIFLFREDTSEGEFKKFFIKNNFLPVLVSECICISKQQS